MKKYITHLDYLLLLIFEEKCMYDTYIHYQETSFCVNFCKADRRSVQGVPHFLHTYPYRIEFR